MTITLYKNYSDSRYLNKNIEMLGSAKPLAPFQDISRDTPRIIVQFNSDIVLANYCYIDIFNRYYYCTVNVMTADRLEIVCRSCDVLMSFKDSLLECSCNTLRSESNATPFITDSKMPINTKRLWKEGILFPNQPLVPSESGSYQYILVGVIGDTEIVGGSS